LLDEEGAGGAGGPALGIVPRRFGDRARRDDIGDREPTAGAQRTERFAIDGRLVGHEVDDAVGEDDVRLRVGDGQVLDLPEAELDVRVLPGPAKGTGSLDHLRCHVDPDDPAARSYPTRGEETVHPRAASKVDDRLPRLQGQESRRVPATEPEVGALRESLEVLDAVAEVDRLGRRAAAPSASLSPATRARRGAAAARARTHGVGPGFLLPGAERCVSLPDRAPQELVGAFAQGTLSPAAFRGA